MKKLILILLFIPLINCSDDSENSNDSNSIEGIWNYISNTDCGEIVENNDCDLESYMTLNNGFGEVTYYDNSDVNENPIPCQIVDYIGVTYSAGSNNQNYIIQFDGYEPASAILDGNTLTLTETYDAIDTSCPQQEGTIIEELIFTRN